jgi:hypothetical protein
VPIVEGRGKREEGRETAGKRKEERGKRYRQEP